MGADLTFYIDFCLLLSDISALALNGVFLTLICAEDTFTPLLVFP